jgi:polyketide synthase PksN
MLLLHYQHSLCNSLRIPLVDAMNSFAQIPLRYEGVYLITGGLGEIGFIIAKYLATEFKAKLILTGRSQLSIDKQAKLEKLKQLGAIVVYLSGDVSDKLTVEDWIKEAKTEFNCIHGIIHCAGILNDSLLLQKDWFSFQAVLAPKTALYCFLL